MWNIIVIYLPINRVTNISSLHIYIYTPNSTSKTVIKPLCMICSITILSSFITNRDIQKAIVIKNKPTTIMTCRCVILLYHYQFTIWIKATACPSKSRKSIVVILPTSCYTIITSWVIYIIYIDIIVTRTLPKLRMKYGVLKTTVLICYRINPTIIPAAVLNIHNQSSVSQ